MLVVMRIMQIRWTRTWAERGGRARPAVAAAKDSTQTTTRSARHLA
jgi:NNP family nitrate/nitrite transporter-like MFS transporter